MRLRAVVTIVALAVTLAGCGGEETAQSTTVPEPSTTTSTTEGVPEAIPLGYFFEPGTTLTHEVDLDQHIDLMSEGDGARAGSEQMPGSMAISLTGTTTFTHTVAEGPEPGTFAITIQGEFTDLTVEGTVDGEEVAPGDVPDVADIAPIDVTIVVDAHGHPISQDVPTGDLFGGDLGGLGGLSGLESLGPGTDLARLVGPSFPDEPVTVGDTWSETIDVPMMMGLEGDPVVTEVTSEITGIDNVDGQDLYVIDTEMVTSKIEFDLAEFLIGFFQAFLPEGATEEDQAQLDALMEDMRFLMTIDETVGNLTTLFDPVAGLARRADFTGDTHLVMDLNMPDQTTGEMGGFTLDMSVDQSVSYRLVGVGGA